SRRTTIQYNVSTFSQLFRDRYASVFLEKPITGKEYRLLVERIKSAIPCFNELHDDEIRIAYKDVHSGCFINIHANVDEQFHLTDTFNNVFTVGAYDRINLKVCRSDSPLLITVIRKKSLIRDDLKEPTFCSSVNNKVRPIAAFTENDDTSTSTSALPKQLNFTADLSEVQGWKENNRNNNPCYAPFARLILPVILSYAPTVTTLLKVSVR
ncbi:Hypothetical predicted protein, partial [Paramuricea clavata]